VSTATRQPLARPPYRSIRIRPWWLLALPVGVLAIVIGSHLMSGPRFVHSVTLVNPTDYTVDVTVSSRDTSGAMPLTSVSKHGSVQVSDVIDMGSVWVFHFRDQGLDGGDFAVSRNALRADGWTVDVPATVALRLAQAGATPDPTL
jgi:hypothetical protein